MRKTIAMLLAMLMLFSLSVSAFAEAELPADELSAEKAAVQKAAQSPAAGCRPWVFPGKTSSSPLRPTPKIRRASLPR